MYQEIFDDIAKQEQNQQTNKKNGEWTGGMNGRADMNVYSVHTNKNEIYINTANMYNFGR